MDLGGDIHLQVLHTSGYTPGSASFSWESKGWLFSGDTVFWGGLIQLLNTPGSEISEYRRGVQVLSGLDVDCLFPGHGLWALGNGQAPD